MVAVLFSELVLSTMQRIEMIMPDLRCNCLPTTNPNLDKNLNWHTEPRNYAYFSFSISKALSNNGSFPFSMS